MRWTAVILMAAAIGVPTHGLMTTTVSAAGPASSQRLSQHPLVSLWRRLFARPAGIPAPADNPQSDAKIALGRQLFYDTRLSGDGNRSCADCHQPALAFTDGRKRALGLSGADLKRNAPSLYNLAWSPHLFHDGRAPSLEAQARLPIGHAEEMRGDLTKIARQLRKDENIATRFAQSFPGSPRVTGTNIVKALAAYERTIISPVTDFDRWIAGDDSALTPDEFAGFQLFAGRAGCISCHRGWRFTDDEFHNIGLKSRDPGRGAIAGGIPGLAAFKTPGLRELRKSAPYMHDGSLATLSEVIDHYTKDFERQKNLSSNMLLDLKLSPREKKQLIAFLNTLSGPS